SRLFLSLSSWNRPPAGPASDGFTAPFRTVPFFAIRIPLKKATSASPEADHSVLVIQSPRDADRPIRDCLLAGRPGCQPRHRPLRAHPPPGQALPVVQEDLLEVAGNLLVEKDQAGVAVVRGPLARPVVAADQDHLAVHDNALGVTGLLHAETRHVETARLEGL